MKTSHSIRSGRAVRRQAGASTAEFLLVMPFALMLVLGIIQIGLMYSAKSLLNHAAFMAARAGAVQNARTGPMNDALMQGLIPFYQDTSNSNDYTRLAGAISAARADVAFVSLAELSPSPDAFADFGITSGASGGHTYIPNDNLEFRSHAAGASSGLSVQDANTLKIKVTYGYALKVPLVGVLVKAIMCGIDSGVNAFGRGNETAHASPSDCALYYSQGRVPLVAYATVPMQTPAWKN